VSGTPDISGLSRPTRESDAPSLFELAPSWKDAWWGMPDFTMGDATPAYRITVNFLTREDVRAFADRLQVRVTPRSDSMWYPTQRIDEPKEWAYVDD
jgi:hypothetical protein